MRRPSRRSFSVRASDASQGSDPTTERTRRGFLSRTVALGTTVGLGGLAAGAATGQEVPVTVSLTLDEEEIPVGGTTDAEIRLSHVPGEGGEYEGIWGATVNLSLEEGVAAFTGEYQTDASWARAEPDMGADDGDHTATITANETNGLIPPGAEDVHLGDVTIEAVGTGDTEVGLEVQSLVDIQDRQFPGEASTTTLRVTEGGLPDPEDDSGGSDDGSGSDGDGGDGSDGDDGGSDGNSDSGGDGGDGSDGSDGGSDGGADGDGDDSDSSDGQDGQPGFGVVATITAILAGVGARAAASSGVEDDGDR